MKINKILIAEIEEVVSELGEPDCRLINPYEYNNLGEFISWPSVTDQKELMMHSDSILTIVDPKPDILEKYFELIS